MTPEKEITLFETVATISADLKHAMESQAEMARTITEHTQADHDNFEKLSDKIDALTLKLTVDDALKADSLEDAKKIAGRRSTIVSVIVSVVSVAAGAWLQRVLGLGTN